MAEEKGLGKFLVYCGLILILFLIMIPIIFSFNGKLIRAELLILLFLMLLSLIGFYGYKETWGERVLFFVFLIGLGNLIFIWYFTGKLFMLPLFLGLVGFLASLPKKEEEDREFDETKKEDEPYSEVLEEDLEEEKEKPELSYLTQEMAKKAEARKTEVSYSPGKYVASKMGSVYHEPKCDWAKRIIKNRMIWFEDKKEARKKGYKEHSCVK